MADDGPVRDSKRARVGDAKGAESASARLEESAGSCSDDNGSVASSTLMTAEDEFGAMAYLLGEPVVGRNPTAAAMELERDVKENPHAVREKLLSLAKGLAGSCACTKPMGKWTKQRPHETPTCGLQQADLVAGVDMEVCVDLRRVDTSRRARVEQVWTAPWIYRCPGQEDIAC